MLRARWTVKALVDFDEAQAWIAHENPAAARMVAQRIHAAVLRLLEHPHAGNAGRVSGARLWVVSRTPYLVVYRVRGEFLEILRLWHGRRDWQGS
jgi:plasmid stabilization system protein ParE